MIKSISLASSCVVNLNEKLNLLLHTVILRIALGTSYEGKEFESGGNLSKLLHGAIAMMVDEHLDPDRQTGEYEDIVDVLLRLEKEQFGEIHFTKDHIKAILMDMYLAGSDTSSLILVWTMSELLKIQE
ncbi:hypothetical protein GIB67_036346 [Kingdonia uniflora]|uniref:Cytochrome P450 n=1 Tax=Kingdonia uniflora TaxID=39325 RepID=A0A7J7L407_9MAGN|nr:hypothetical protein GIB67_036346 [Kingdonia uniflora]